MSRLSLACAIGVVVVVCAFFALRHRSEVSRTVSPDGHFAAVTTVSSWRRFVPVGPGQGSDLPCYVEIFRDDGVSMGELPVEMIQLADVEWVPDGAAIKLVGNWDFVKGLCWYWDPEGKSYTYVRRHGP